VAAAVYLGWRIFGRRLKKSEITNLREGTWPGADSELFLLEKKLAVAGLGRNDGETSAEWLTRARETIPALEPTLRELLTLHYRYRFDPAGIGPGEREQLRRVVRAVLLHV
jgi:protein-glutamine gamma-glutamyltransferase